MVWKLKINKRSSILKKCNSICTRALKKEPNTYATAVVALSFWPFSFVRKLHEYNPFSEKINKTNWYWIRQSLEEVLDDADGLFQEEQYLQVYELLNRLKFKNNADVQWRICRALFKMSCNKGLSENVRTEMISEAYDLISSAVKLGPDNPDAHKWMAIIIDCKTGLDSTIARVKSFDLVKTHLQKAAELNPNDVSVLYMLGNWCFEMSNLSWYQRKLSAVFFMEPPISTYEEAYTYFLRAEQIKPRFYLPNLYMLGRVSFLMKQYFRARYYLNLAATLPPRTRFEKQCALEAKQLSNELQQFDVAKDALLYGISGPTRNFH